MNEFPAELIGSVCAEAIEHYGDDIQTQIAIEELSELIQAIIKMKRIEKQMENDDDFWEDNNNVNVAEARTSNLHEEIADVEIMLEQLKIIYDCHKEVEDFKDKKILRLHTHIRREIVKKNDDLCNGCKNNYPHLLGCNCLCKIEKEN